MANIRLTAVPPITKRLQSLINPSREKAIKGVNISSRVNKGTMGGLPML